MPQSTLAALRGKMTMNIPFRRVATFADDAITVRVESVEGTLFGVIDFPSFLRADGKLIKATEITSRPLAEALALAERILPHTPFLEVVILGGMED